MLELYAVFLFTTSAQILLSWDLFLFCERLIEKKKFCVKLTLLWAQGEVEGELEPGKIFEDRKCFNFVRGFCRSQSTLWLQVSRHNETRQATATMQASPCQKLCIDLTGPFTHARRIPAALET